MESVTERILILKLTESEVNDLYCNFFSKDSLNIQIQDISDPILLEFFEKIKEFSDPL